MLRRNRFDHSTTSNRWSPTYDTKWFYYDNMNVLLTKDVAGIGNSYYTNTKDQIRGNESSKLYFIEILPAEHECMFDSNFRFLSYGPV